MIVVTGGAGFIGSRTIWALNQAGLSEILVVDNLGTTDKWRNLVGLDFLDYIPKADFLAKLEAGALGGVEAIVHLGACSSTREKDVDYLLSNNTEYSKRLARYAAGNGLRFINASSAAVYGDGGYGFEEDLLFELRPLNAYGYSKLLFDQWAYRSGLMGSMASLRFFNVYGPGENHKDGMESVVLKAYRQIKDMGSLDLFKSHREGIADGEQERDFVYVDDCADLILWLLEAREVSGIFNVGTGEARSFLDFGRAAFSAMEREEKIGFVYMPYDLRKNYQYRTEADLNGLRRVGCPVGFRSIEKGVSAYVEHLKQEGESHG